MITKLKLLLDIFGINFKLFFYKERIDKMSGKNQRNKNTKSDAKSAKSGMLIPVIAGVAAAAIIITLAYLAAFGGRQKEETKMNENVKVLVEMENGSDFTLELYPKYAPKTVENFVKLVNEGFYDGLTFHRVVEGFMAQGGDPEGTGMGGSDETIPGEFSANGFSANTLSHTRGVISMARSQNYDSASSQFFICYDDASFLDGQYAAFGKVIDGMETVDAFLKAERSYNEMGELATPVKPIVMKKLTVIK